MYKQAIVLSTDSSKLEIYDKRLNPPFVAKPKGHQKEIILQHVDSIKIDNKTFRYLTPNNVALHLAIADKALNNSKEVYKKITKSVRDNNHPELNCDFELLIGDSKLVCDYLQEIQSFIVFSFTAIETFINLSIPNNYIYTKRTNKCLETYNKQQIERNVNWKAKIKEILVDVYKTSDITQEKYWPKFCEIGQLRDNIVHQKSSNDTEFFERLFKPDIFKSSDVVKNIINFFKQNTLDRSTKLSDVRMQGNEKQWPILDEDNIMLGVLFDSDVKHKT